MFSLISRVYGVSSGEFIQIERFNYTLSEDKTQIVRLTDPRLMADFDV